jgi:hypothetical protein
LEEALDVLTKRAERFLTSNKAMMGKAMAETRDASET